MHGATSRAGARARGRICCALVLVLAGCASPAVRTEHDPSFDFASARSWQWSRHAENLLDVDPRLASDRLHEQLRTALADALTARGLRALESGADLAVAYQLGVVRQREVEAEPIDRPTGDNVFVGVPRVTLRDTERGRLVVLLHDPSDGRVVWRGSAQAPLHHASAPEERDRRVRDAARAILEKYPPRR